MSGQNSSVRSGYSGQVSAVKASCSQEVRLVDQDRSCRLGPVMSVRSGQVGESGQPAG